MALQDEGRFGRLEQATLYPWLSEVKKRRRGTTRVSAKHQVTIPAEAFRAAGLRTGDVLEVVSTEPGRVELRRAENPFVKFAGDLTGVYPPGYLDELRDEWDR